jgi:hypothetical protein
LDGRHCVSSRGDEPSTLPPEPHRVSALPYAVLAVGARSLRGR